MSTTYKKIRQFNKKYVWCQCERLRSKCSSVNSVGKQHELKRKVKEYVRLWEKDFYYFVGTAGSHHGRRRILIKSTTAASQGCGLLSITRITRATTSKTKTTTATTLLATIKGAVIKIKALASAWCPSATEGNASHTRVYRNPNKVNQAERTT